MWYAILCINNVSSNTYDPVSIEPTLPDGIWPGSSDNRLPGKRRNRRHLGHCGEKRQSASRLVPLHDSGRWRHLCHPSVLFR